MEKIALITGATAGIGKATAFLLAENSYDIIITGRRKKRLNDLKNEIENKTKARVYPVCFDIMNKCEVNNSIRSLPDEWKNIEVLINNAGLALGLEPIQDGNIEKWEQMIDTNIKGVLYISKIVSEIMIKTGRGHIINIGSIAGKEVYRNGNVYCATKHAVDALTKAMRIDLLPHLIKVTQVSPGATNTEFSTVRFDGDKEKADNLYLGFNPLLAVDIAEIILFVLQRPEHVNINDILVMPAAQASAREILKKK